MLRLPSNEECIDVAGHVVGGMLARGQRLEPDLIVEAIKAAIRGGNRAYEELRQEAYPRDGLPMEYPEANPWAGGEVIRY